MAVSASCPCGIPSQECTGSRATCFCNQDTFCKQRVLAKPVYLPLRLTVILNTIETEEAVTSESGQSPCNIASSDVSASGLCVFGRISSILELGTDVGSLMSRQGLTGAQVVASEAVLA